MCLTIRSVILACIVSILQFLLTLNKPIFRFFVVKNLYFVQFLKLRLEHLVQEYLKSISRIFF